MAASNAIAFLVACNLPLYPLTLWLATGANTVPTFLAALNTPVFLAVPLVSRRNALMGRVLLVVVGTVNSFISTKVTGQATGAELYLVPCFLTAAFAFRSSERLVSWTLLALIAAVLFRLHGHLGEAIQPWAPDDYAVLIRVNAASAVLLTAFVGLALARAQRADRRRLS